MPKLNNDIVNIEIELLIEAIYKRYSYNFHAYSRAHIKRIVLKFMRTERIAHVAELQRLILYNSEVFYRLILGFSSNVSEMFRDPSFYKSFIARVIPDLRTCKSLRFWNAGCSTGEDVYSLAILLKKLGLYNISKVLATEFNPIMLEKASKAIFSLSSTNEYVKNYNSIELDGDLSEFFTKKNNSLILNKELKTNIRFLEHSLVAGENMEQMNVIICRNVLIYFERKLQDRVFGLFHESLVKGGYLCLGLKENMNYSPFNDSFELIDSHMKIYRKIK